jgi:glycosyltransferase involved in cell wall biosynthesis
MILLIGAVNTGLNPTGGEEYKNQLLVDYLRCRYDLTVIDTFRWEKRPTVIPQIVLNLLFRRYHYIIISACAATTYRLIQFLNVFPYLIRKTIYLVVGGNFHNAVQQRIYQTKYYEKLHKVFVEGNQMKQTLIETGLLHNVAVMPNFKSVKQVFDKKQVPVAPPIRFVFMSRIIEAKGVLTIFDALDELKVSHGTGSLSVDFFGPIEPLFNNLFQRRLEEHTSTCTYKGYLDIMGNPEDAYRTLSTYDCMLFPTYWLGEGFPGIIIDTYICGLPVIATDWNMNREVVVDGETGFIIPIKDSGALARVMTEIIQCPDILNAMREQCFKRAFEYDYNSVLNRDLQPLLVA